MKKDIIARQWTGSMVSSLWTGLCFGMVAVLMAGVLSACSDDVIIVQGPAPDKSDPQADVDQMAVKVTADIPTAVLSQFDEKSMGGALVRRLSNTSGRVTDETKMILIKGEDIMGRPLTEWAEAARIYLRGGFIAIEKPHDAHLVNMMEQLSARLEKASLDVLQEDDGSGIIVKITPPNGQSSVGAISADAERFKTRIANIEKRAGESASNNEPVAEMVIFSNNGYYSCAPMGTKNIVTSTRDKSGNVKSKRGSIMQEYTAYETGLQADGAARWLNNRDEVQKVRNAATRGNGGDAINDLMSADEEFTYQGPLNAYYCYDSGIALKQRSNALNEIIRVWGVHSMDINKDYYFVDHKIVASVGGKMEGKATLNRYNESLYGGPYPEEWPFYVCIPFGGESSTSGQINDGSLVYNLAYGAWFGGGDYSMNLTGSGSVLLEDAKPSTDNNEGSKTVTVGSFEATTTTIGATVTPGFSQKMGASFNASGTFTRGYTEGKVFVMGSTVGYKELTCQKNTDGTKVSWTYGCGPDMLEGDWNKHPMAPDALIGDVDMNNQACWSVGNPEGNYTVNIDQKTLMSTLISADKDEMKDWAGTPGDKTILNVADESKSLTYTLLVPNRAQQTWYMDVDFPELGQEGFIGVKDELTEALKTQFPNIYQPTLDLADLTPESENTIRRIVMASKGLLTDENALQTLKGYAKDRGISQFTIKWYCTEGTHSVYEMTVQAK